MITTQLWGLALLAYGFAPSMIPTAPVGRDGAPPPAAPAQATPAEAAPAEAAPSWVVPSVPTVVPVPTVAAHFAAGPIQPRVGDAATETHWYGWQLMLVDVSSFLVLAKSGNDAGRMLGAAGLVLGAPTLHIANHNVGGAIASFAVRGGVTALVLALASDSSAPCPQQGDPTCPVGMIATGILDAGIALGLVFGGLIFAIVDDTALAKVVVPSRPPLTTFVAPRPGGLSWGVGGTF